MRPAPPRRSSRRNADLVIDTETFEAAARTALRGQEPGACEGAADLYDGELLPDDRYAEWVEGPRKQLQARSAQVLKAGKLWERLVALDPTDEQAQCALMQAALDAGNRGEVVRQFQGLRERLRLDCGMGPKASTIALYERALAAPAFAPVSLVEKLRASLAWGLVHLHSGDFTKAELIARETRDLAFGEASALLGMTAHRQGRWLDLYRSEFIEWVRSAPAFVARVFDGHLCLAQFSMCGAAGHEQIGAVARELLAAAEIAGSSAGRGLALLCLGDAAFFSGNLDEAERLLLEAEPILVETGTAAGQAMVLERLAELGLARGQKWRASRLVQRGLSVAETSWLSPHFIIRLRGLAVQMASTPEQAAEAIREGDRALATANTCQPCSMGFRAAAAIALAEAGELEDLARRLDEAERLAGMWNGGPWVATLWEALCVQRRAQGSEDRALAALGEAAARFAELGRPLDEARCQARKRGALSTREAEPS